MSPYCSIQPTALFPSFVPFQILVAGPLTCISKVGSWRCLQGTLVVQKFRLYEINSKRNAAVNVKKHLGSFSLLFLSRRLLRRVYSFP